MSDPDDAMTTISHSRGARVCRRLRGLIDNHGDERATFDSEHIRYIRDLTSEALTDACQAARDAGDLAMLFTLSRELNGRANARESCGDLADVRLFRLSVDIDGREMPLTGSLCDVCQAIVPAVTSGDHYRWHEELVRELTRMDRDHG